MRRFILAALLLVVLALPARAADPIRIGFSDNLTGGSAPNGKQILLAFEIWRDDVNAKGVYSGPAESSWFITTTRPIPRTCRRFIRSSSTSTRSICWSDPTAPISWRPPSR